jgi:hypothetical protein
MQKFEEEWNRIIKLLQAEDRVVFPKETVKSLCYGFYVKGGSDTYDKAIKELKNIQEEL